MANELSVTGSFTFAKNGIAAFARAVTALSVSVNGNGGVYEPGLSIATGSTALQLGGLTTPFGWAWFHNLDPVNYVTILASNGGTVIAQLMANEMAFFRLGSGVTAPYGTANVAAVLLEYCILPP